MVRKLNVKRETLQTFEQREKKVNSRFAFVGIVCLILIYTGLIVLAVLWGQK